MLTGVVERPNGPAIALAYAAERWEDRGGGGVFAFTHGWRGIHRASFGPIRILASAEKPEDISAAHQRGYDVAIVLPSFPGARAFDLPGTDVKVIPCPAQTRGTTCVQCRLCISAPLREHDRVIGFAAHGHVERVRRRLRVINGTIERCESDQLDDL